MSAKKTPQAISSRPLMNAGGPEPRFMQVAAAIGDPARARMLTHLLGNEYASSGEMARSAGVTAQTASAHLARMLEADLVKVRAQGRHRYFCLASDDVAQALEALSVVAEHGSRPDPLWSRNSHRALRQGRTCYGHLAGKLGVALHDRLLEHQYVTFEQQTYRITAAGRERLATIGFSCEPLPAHRRGVVFPCLDWSERRDHFAGPLATALLKHFCTQRWVHRLAESRAVKLTSAGRTHLTALLGDLDSL